MLLKTAVQLRARTSRHNTALIVNPNSRGGMTGRNWNEIYPRIEKAFGKGVKVVFSEKHGGGTEQARDLLRKGFTKVVAVGGDGTINEVANGFFEDRNGSRGTKLGPINPDAVMGIVPCGSRNVLARSLGLPIDFDESIAHLARAKPAKMDLITVSATDPETAARTHPRAFLNAAEMGLGAEIIDRSKKARAVVKSRLVSTVAAIMSTLPAYESNLCDVFVDGRKKAINMTMGVVANGKFLGGGFMASPEASVSDGLFDLVILKDSGSLKVLDELFNVKTGTYDRENNIFYTKAKKVVIRSNERRVTVTIDGEPAGILPATFQVLPGALLVAA